MTWTFLRLIGLLLCSGLTACATTLLSASEKAEVEQAFSSFDEACAEEGSLLALCDAEECKAYRCKEVLDSLTASGVVLARTGGMALPGPGAQRFWGSAQVLPKNTQPVFIIPWGPRPQPELLPSQKLMLEEMQAQRRRPHELHHIFPQEKELKEWFISKGIDIHMYTLPVEVEVHRRIHQQPPQGGPWNEAWRRFKKANDSASKMEIERYAGQLIYEFGLYGAVIPYRRKAIQPPPIGGW
jgi:uncharacterized lipoprotein (TIGR02269 family)